MPTTGQAAKQIGVNLKTITNWIDKEELSRFFSRDAGKDRNTPHRQLTHGDMDVLLTINYLMNVSKSDHSWEQIAAYLDTGKRETQYPISGETLDTKTVTMNQAEQLARSAMVVAERDAALQRVGELEERITKIESDHKAEIEFVRQAHKAELDKLLNEIRQLNREVGRLEGRISSTSQDLEESP